MQRRRREERAAAEAPPVKAEERAAAPKAKKRKPPAAEALPPPKRAKPAPAPAPARRPAPVPRRPSGAAEDGGFVSLAEAVAGCGGGWAVVADPPLALGPHLLGRRLAMKGVGARGESWCWGRITQWLPPGSPYHAEVAWGGRQTELRDTRLELPMYCASAQLALDIGSSGWCLLEGAEPPPRRRR